MLFNKIFLGIFLHSLICTEAQRTELDKYAPILRSMRLLYRNMFGGSGSDIEILKIHRNLGKFQKEVPSSQSFYCDTKNSPPKRSIEPPLSVHELRPGDIDIIAGMGDSSTAGNGIVSIDLMQIGSENRGLSWSIGGQGNWKKYLTLPNILKQFNPKLYGYSLGDSYSFEKTSRFNVAEPGAMSRDMSYQAKVLLLRLQNDPKVDMQKHWKILTIFIGGNDFCTDVCFFKDPLNAAVRHQKDMIKTLRFLRDNIPRLLINLVPVPNVGNVLLGVKGQPQHCHLTHLGECSCFVGLKNTKEILKNNFRVYEEWLKKDLELGELNEFNTKEFTVNIQPFTISSKFPLLKNGATDFRYFAEDCFHLSQRAHARSANSLWNNMLEPYKNKTKEWTDVFSVFKCPTKARPFLTTRENSWMS